jgi:hypothetical protein
MRPLCPGPRRGPSPALGKGAGRGAAARPDPTWLIGPPPAGPGRTCRHRRTVTMLISRFGAAVPSRRRNRIGGPAVRRRATAGLHLRLRQLAAAAAAVTAMAAAQAAGPRRRPPRWRPRQRSGPSVVTTMTTAMTGRRRLLRQLWRLRSRPGHDVEGPLHRTRTGAAPPPAAPGGPQTRC